ncbi:12455_t:CDS:2, partial [Racocetra fulgida]
MACAYKADSIVWKLTTRFIDGPSGNPFLSEKWLWEGVIDLLKGEEDYEKEFCKVEEITELKKEKKDKNFLEGWEVVYERKESCDELEQQVSSCNQNEHHFKIVCKRTPLNNLPFHYKSPLLTVRSLFTKRSPIFLDIGSERYNQCQQEKLCDSNIAECCSQQQQQHICNGNENSLKKVGKRSLSQRTMNIGNQSQMKILKGRSHKGNYNGLYKKDGNYRREIPRTPRFT